MMDDSRGFEYNFNRKEDARRRSKRITQRGHETEVETGEGLPRAKRRTPVSRRRTTAQPRRNRPNQNIREMSLQCCTERTCLLNYDRPIIASIRSDFDSKLYDEQNSYLNSLIDVEPKDKRNRIAYNIRDVSGLRKVKVCKTAFLKIFGIGKKRVAVLLKKIQPYSGDVEKDKRALNRNAKKLPLSLKAEVVEHIRSYERDQSHYAREKTREKQYLASNLTIAQLFRDFLEKKDIPVGGKSPISYSAFRKLFRTFNISFRKPHVDTCGRCDSFSIIIKHSRDEDERKSARELKLQHIDQADAHYDCIHFDLRILPKRKNKEQGLPWMLPELWK